VSEFSKISKALRDIVLDFDTQRVEFLSWGHFLVDIATGGGIPLGRMVELFGVEGVGKTTLAIQACVQAQRVGRAAVYIDTEGCWDPTYSSNLGLDLSAERLAVAQPMHAEQAFEAIHSYIRTNEVGIVVLDTVAGAQPKGALDTTKATPGLHSQVISRELRRLVKPLSTSKASLILVNQLRSTWDEQTAGALTAGGRALKYYATTRIELRRISGVRMEPATGIVIARLSGMNINLTVIKNKLAAPFRQAEIVLEFGRGFSEFESIVEAMIAAGDIRRTGSFFEWRGTKYHGFQKLKEAVSAEDRAKLIQYIKDTYQRLPEPR